MLICVGIPTIDGKVCAATVDSLLAEQVRALGQGDAILVLWQVGCSLIGHARNRIVADFLAIEAAKCLVFVDSDISWKCGDLLKLAHSRHDVIGATYRTKERTERYHTFGKRKRVGKLYQVGGIPGGFMKVSRAAFDRLEPQAYLDQMHKFCRDWFPTGFNPSDGVFYGEDYGFCRLWRESGGTVWLDPAIILKHHGGNQVYTGDPAGWLRRQPK